MQICYWLHMMDSQRGTQMDSQRGTQMTVQYAKQMGIQVCCIKPTMY